jgi:hypothetical protein
MEDIIRGLWMQRLLCDLDSHVALLPATVIDRSFRCGDPVCIPDDTK